MAAMPSASDLALAIGQPLLEVARRSIAHGLEQSRPLVIAVDEYPEQLRDHGAAFVTLHKQNALRGCIGNLNPHQPLVRDVADNAFSAAFRDPRFPAVSATELADIHIEISVLSPRQPIEFDTEEALLAALDPMVDGVVLEDGRHRGTFLPVVWKQLPDRRDFLQHLKRKSGLPADYWSATLRAYRYRTTSYAE